ncbi:MAG: DUF6504 family protein [Candidatus Zixiibacteriota bacterium]
MPEFFSDKIDVQRDDKTKDPACFCWKDKEYKIKEVLSSWSDWKFSAGAPKRKNWRLRHHRVYYRIKTEDNQVFEIYLDRKTKKEDGEWVLYRRLD